MISAVRARGRPSRPVKQSGSCDISVPTYAGALAAGFVDTTMTLCRRSWSAAERKFRREFEVEAVNLVTDQALFRKSSQVRTIPFRGRTYPARWIRGGPRR